MTVDFHTQRATAVRRVVQDEVFWMRQQAKSWGLQPKHLGYLSQNSSCLGALCCSFSGLSSFWSLYPDRSRAILRHYQFTFLFTLLPHTVPPRIAYYSVPNDLC